MYILRRTYTHIILNSRHCEDVGSWRNQKRYRERRSARSEKNEKGQRLHGWSRRQEGNNGPVYPLPADLCPEHLYGGGLVCAVHEPTYRLHVSRGQFRSQLEPIVLICSDCPVHYSAETEVHLDEYRYGHVKGGPCMNKTYSIVLGSLIGTSQSPSTVEMMS